MTIGTDPPTAPGSTASGISSWTFPYGMAINFTYQANTDGLEDLYKVTNTLGRSIHFTTSGFAGFDNTLTGSNAQSVVTSIPFSGASETDTTQDPAGATTSINWTLQGYRYVLNNVITPDDPTTPSLEYQYDPLNRVQYAYDGVATHYPSTRGPYLFTYGEQSRGERTDPAGGVYTVIYDIYRHPLQYTDELGNATSLTHDGLGRVTGYTYPEGNQQLLTYDSQNNTASLQRIAKQGSTLTFQPIQAVWNQTWNKPSSITDSMGCLTTFAYVPTGTNGTSLLQNATRCKPDSTQSNPVYLFTFNAYGQTLSTTDPSGLQISNTYDTLANSSNLLITTLDPTGVDAPTSYTYDATGNVSTVTDPRNYVTQNQYDADRRETYSYHYNGAVTTSLLSAEHTVYDALGRDTNDQAASAVSGTSVTTWQTTKTTSYTYTSKIYRVEDGMGDTTTHAYDKMDRENLVTDPVNRMVGTVYDLAGHTLCIYRAWNSTTAPSTCGTPNPSGYTGSQPIQYATYSYSPNGNRLTELDANNNLTTLSYDGVDRASQTEFPLPTEASGLSDSTDVESYSYDPNDNRLTFTTRDKYVISYTYDALNRKTVKTVPAGAQSAAYTAYYGYDLAGRPTCAHFGSTSGLGNVVCSTGTGIGYTYDTAKRITVETNTLGSSPLAMSYQYDKASNRTVVTWPDGNYMDYDFDGLNRVFDIRENGATSGVGLLVDYGYDPMSHLTSVTRGNGTSSSLQYDLASRLTALNHTMASQSQALSLDYTTASQLLTRTSSNTSYDWAPADGSTAYTANGLNEYASVAGTGYSSDGRGNLTSAGARTMSYDLENHLLSVVGGAGLTLQYDPLGRIWQTTSGSTVTQFLYDEDRLVGEYSNTGTVLQRYAHGPRTDDPEVWYEGSAMTTREWIHTDERGSVIATTDSTGTPTIYTYGPNGEPPSSSAWTGSRFRYTGQIALPEAQLYHYKARVYDPGLGRFFQTDPVGTKDDLNLYAYVYNDPTDKTDPAGDQGVPIQDLQFAQQFNAMAQGEQAKAAQEAGYYQALAQAGSYENRQIALHSIATAASAADLAFPATAPITETVSALAAGGALADTYFTIGSVSPIDLTLAAVSVVPAGKLLSPVLKDGARLADATRKGLSVGTEALAATKALADSTAKSKGYDNITVNKDGAVKATVMPTGTRLQQTTTCTAPGQCTSNY